MSYLRLQALLDFFAALVHTIEPPEKVTPLEVVHDVLNHFVRSSILAMLRTICDEIPKEFTENHFE